MSQILLSICIPTYNFGEFIGETIDSVIPQMEEDIELVIVDGASTDNTRSIVESYIAHSNRNIRYECLPKKGGIDRDMARTATLAKGTYVWFFSSDDVMFEGAIFKLRGHLSSGVDAYLCGHMIYTKDLKKLISNHPIFSFKEVTDFNLSKETDRVNYFQNATTTAAFFSFISSVIIRKDRWDQIELEEKFYKTCWALAARILQLFSLGLTVRFIPEPYLKKRSENDSFLDHGHIARFALTVDGFMKIGTDVFGEGSFEFSHIKRSIQNEQGLKEIIKLKSQVTGENEVRELKRLIDKLYSDKRFKFLAYMVAFYLFPPQAAAYLRKMYRTVKDSLR